MELKKMHRVKSYDRKKWFYENWAKNGRNPLYSCSKHKMGGHWPRMVGLSWNFFCTGMKKKISTLLISEVEIATMPFVDVANI